ncbi:hypothetical protein SAMN04488115_107205 [Bosea lathyri]|uniref:Uncharacterized protein n=1 Tax=Bosea lathyri TaxID=1036778 RepID=A0A1H6BGU6_9HYPH|nr:hypothetical protein SAMN04488115_107205 [Bosea lathyri]
MMRIHERGRARLIMRLPSWRARFERSSSQSFLDVCEAYEQAWVALEQWSRSERPTSSTMVADYREIVASLELDAKLYATSSVEEP